MNKILLILLLLQGNLGCQLDKTSVELKIDEAFRSTPQWVYWFALQDNDLLLLDSTYITSENDFYTLDADINREKEYLSWFTFEKNGPIQITLSLNPEDKRKIEIFIERDYTGWVKCNGSLATEENYKREIKGKNIRDSINILRDSLISNNNDSTQDRISSKIKKYKDYLEIEYFLDFLQETNSPINALIMLDVLSLKLSKTKLDSLVEIAKKRFPSYEQIQNYPKVESYPKESEASKIVTARFRKIVNSRLGYKENETPKVIEDSLKTVKPYQVGDIVKDIHIKGLYGKEVNLKDIKTEYVLIDFWASWCIPCRKETPCLRNAVEAYSDKLSVFAISFCNSEREWKETIEKDNSGMFIHGYSGNFKKTKSSNLLRAQFGIKAIPANFLLDKDRRIIATDLRGDDLINKMKELAVK